MRGITGCVARFLFKHPSNVSVALQLFSPAPLIFLFGFTGGVTATTTDFADSSPDDTATTIGFSDAGNLVSSPDDTATTIGFSDLFGFAGGVAVDVAVAVAVAVDVDVAVAVDVDVAVDPGPDDVTVATVAAALTGSTGSFPFLNFVTSVSMELKLSSTLSLQPSNELSSNILHINSPF